MAERAAVVRAAVLGAGSEAAETEAVQTALVPKARGAVGDWARVVRERGVAGARAPETGGAAREVEARVEGRAGGAADPRSHHEQQHMPGTQGREHARESASWGAHRAAGVLTGV